MLFNMHEAKTKLSALVESALKGEEVIIANAGRPLVKLVPVDSVQTDRQLGGYENQVVIDTDLSAEDIEDLFYKQP